VVGEKYGCFHWLVIKEKSYFSKYIKEEFISFSTGKNYI